MSNKFLSLLIIAGLLIFYSCKKNNEQVQLETPPIATGDTRFKFLLYSTKNFSEEHLVHFKMYIRNNRNILVDSAVASMRLKDIPGEDNKLVFERTIPAAQPGTFRAGFIYTIENVGMSWHLETCDAGIKEKIIDFNFM